MIPAAAPFFDPLSRIMQPKKKALRNYYKDTKPMETNVYSKAKL
jgi:hypothetical protein